MQMDHMEGAYSLMPENSVSNAETTKLRTKSSSLVETFSINPKPVRRHTNTGQGEKSNETLIPLITEDKIVQNSEETDEIIIVNRDENVISKEGSEESVLTDEENDTLTPLASVPISPGHSSRRKGILKQLSVTDSNSFNEYGSSPISINSSLSPSSSVISQGGWRRDSKVHFKPSTSTQNTIGKFVH